ncbi:hypothetical protein ACFLWA_07980 [Chloroflexota bacterium]
MTVGNEVYAANLALYEALVATNPDVERKGATIPYTSLNGHMFSFLSKQGQVGLRLPKKERERFLEKYKTELVVQYDRVMKEYVAVPDSLLGDTDQLAGYFEISYAYVGSLKPKPTKRKPAKK